jgi:HEPN domain-containing protein
MERSADWMRQAERDLESAKCQMEHNFFEWACFLSQQSAEKALKSVYQKMGAEVWGHSVKELIEGLCEKIEVPEEFVNKAKSLDKFYIPARYPNGWPSGIPAEYITKEDAISAISNSEKILQFCKNFLAK